MGTDNLTSPPFVKEKKKRKNPQERQYLFEKCTGVFYWVQT